MALYRACDRAPSNDHYKSAPRLDGTAGRRAPTMPRGTPTPKKKKKPTGNKRVSSRGPPNHGQDPYIARRKKGKGHWEGCNDGKGGRQAAPDWASGGAPLLNLGSHQFCDNLDGLMWPRPGFITWSPALDRLRGPLPALYDRSDSLRTSAWQRQNPFCAFFTEAARLIGAGWRGSRCWLGNRSDRQFRAVFCLFKNFFCLV